MTVIQEDSLVIRRCVNTTEAIMKTARLVEEDGREVNVSVGCVASVYGCHPVGL